MLKMAYRRRARTIRRTRRTGRKKGTVLTQLKKYVKKELNAAVEHKSVTWGSTLSKGEEIPYRTNPIGCNITPGVTDGGRIGNTVHLSRITCRFVMSAKLGTDITVEDRWPPVTLKIFLIQSGNQSTTISTNWFKAFDQGSEDPYVELTNESINDGRYVVNTDSFKILGAYSKTLKPSLSAPLSQYTGKCTFKLNNKKLTFIHNGTSNSVPFQVIPGLDIVYYFYTGFTAEAESPKYDYDVRMRTFQYYKDT